MVPHTPAIGHQEPLEQSFLVEKPGFDITVTTGVEDDLEGNPEDAASSNNNRTL